MSVKSARFKGPKWFIPGPRDERKSTGSGGASARENGQPVIAGGRCRDAGIMPPPSSLRPLQQHRQIIGPFTRLRP